MMKLLLNVNSILQLLLLEEMEETVDLPKVAVLLHLVVVLVDLLLLVMLSLLLVCDQVDQQLVDLELQVLLLLVDFLNLEDFPSHHLQVDFLNMDQDLQVDFLNMDQDLQVDFLSKVQDLPVDFLNRDLQVDLLSLPLVHMVHLPQLRIPGLHET